MPQQPAVRRVRTAAVAALGVATLLITAAGQTTPALGAPSAPAGSGPQAADTTPPPAPTMFRMTGRIDGQPSTLGFFWYLTFDQGYAVPKYELSHQGGTTVIDNFRTWASVQVAGLDPAPGNAYDFQLRAIDAAGNKSAPAHFEFETTPPGVATDLRLVSVRQGGYPQIIEWTAAPDNSGTISYYEIFLNGQSLGPANADPRVDLFHQIINVACLDDLPRGQATIQVRAVDGSLNSGPLSAPLTVTFP